MIFLIKPVDDELFFFCASPKNQTVQGFADGAFFGTGVEDVDGFSVDFQNAHMVKGYICFPLRDPVDRSGELVFFRSDKDQVACLDLQVVVGGLMLGTRGYSEREPYA